MGCVLCIILYFIVLTVLYIIPIIQGGSYWMGDDLEQSAVTTYSATASRSSRPAAGTSGSEARGARCGDAEQHGPRGMEAEQQAELGDCGNLVLQPRSQRSGPKLLLTAQRACQLHRATPTRGPRHAGGVGVWIKCRSHPEDRAWGRQSATNA